MSAPQRRLMRVMRAFAGNNFVGLRLRDLAAELQEAPPTVLRDLQAMEAEGFAERIPGREDYWRLGPALLRLSNAHTTEIAKHRARIDEFETRCSRHPN